MTAYWEKLDHIPCPCVCSHQNPPSLSTRYTVIQMVTFNAVVQKKMTSPYTRFSPGSLSDNFQKWKISSSAQSKLAHKSLLRVVGAFFVVFGLLLLTRNLVYGSAFHIPTNLRGFDIIDYESYKQSFKAYGASQHRYPQDWHVPVNPSGGISVASRIGKVTALFYGDIIHHGQEQTFVRAIRSHDTHNQRYGYPMLILRHDILQGTWSKPAYILSALLEEMRKPEKDRLEWLL